MIQQSHYWVFNLPKEHDNTNLKGNMHPDVYSSIVYNSLTISKTSLAIMFNSLFSSVSFPASFLLLQGNILNN